MVDVTHVAEENAKGPDESLHRVAEIMAGKSAPIRMRINIQLWDGQDYVSWKGQTWKLEVANAEEAKQVQQALESFFDLVAIRSSDSTKQLLDNALNGQAIPLVVQGEEQQSGSQTDIITD